MEDIIDTIRKCKTCKQIKELSFFRNGRMVCRKCVSIQENQKKRDQNYFELKYQEQRADRLLYQHNYHNNVIKPKRMKQLQQELESQAQAQVPK